MKMIPILFAVLSIFNATAPSAFALDTEQRATWREDIEYYRTTLAERHINLYHSINEEAFNAELNRLVTDLPQLNEHQVVFELMRITRLIGDGHTQFPIMAGPHQHFPFKFRLLATTCML